MSFLTGSHAYGTPYAESDIDLVVLVTNEETCQLADFADQVCGDERSGGDDAAASMRFGKLNLICVTNEGEYDAWRRATEDLIGRRPVTREEAVKAIKTALQAENERRQRIAESFVDGCIAELAD